MDKLYLMIGHTFHLIYPEKKMNKEMATFQNHTCLVKFRLGTTKGATDRRKKASSEELCHCYS